MSYKISIIIPVYNVEDYLENTLNSIISQTIGIENIEVILIDDKSSDNSKNIIKNYVKRYDNFKGVYFDKGSGFPGKPRNEGLKYATSEYIMYLDSDDWLEDNACEVLYNTITHEKADIVCGSFTKIHNDGKRKLNYSSWVSTLNDPNENPKGLMNKTKKIVDDPNFKLIVTDLNKNGTILANANVWGKIFKKELIVKNEISFPEDIVAQDSVFLLESFYNAKKTVFINDVIVNYNNNRDKQGDTSISYVKTNENLFGRIKAYHLMYDISKKYSNEELFYKYLLKGKLSYWFNSFLLESNLSTFEIMVIFKRYYHLFSNCYIFNSRLSADIKNVFKDIHDKKFYNAASKVSKIQSKSIPKVKNPIKVSVIIPVYNNEKFLKKCLDSVINQTLKEIEIICVDDGSTDNSINILKQYERDDSRFKIISQKNLGAANARNNGLIIANGEYVSFLDSDDWLELNAFEKLYENAKSNQSDLVLFNSIEHKHNGNLKKRIYLKNDSITDHMNFSFNFRYKKHLVMNGYLVIWSKFYKTSFLKEKNIKFSNHRIFNDVQFHIKSMVLANKISYCPSILYHYLRIDQPSLQNNVGRTNESFILIDIMDEIEEYLINQNFYNELKSYFNKFKLTELEGRLNILDHNYKEEFYNLIRENLKKMNLSEYQRKKLPKKNLRFFINVINYASFYEYAYYQKAKINYEINDKNFKQLLKNKSQLIVYLNNELTKVQQINSNKVPSNSEENENKDLDYLKDYLIYMESILNYEEVNKDFIANLEKSESENKLLAENLEKSESENKLLAENLEKSESENKLLAENLEKSESENKLLAENLEKSESENKLLAENLEACENKLNIINNEFQITKQENIQNEKNISKLIRVNNSIRDSQKIIDRLSEELLQHQASIQKLLNENNELKSNLKEIETKNKELKNVENKYKNSRSWKFTKPLRKINNSLK